MRKICVVTGNRAEYGKLKPVMQEIKKHPKLELILIVTASHLLDDFGKSVELIKSDGFEISAAVRTVAAGEDLISMVKSVGLTVLELSTLFEMYKPDVVLITGDRFDILGVAISAAFMNIPIAHMEGGETTGSIDESIRHAITKFSHIHFPANQKSAERIIKMGERSDMVFNVGCPSVDIMLSIKSEPDSILEKYRLEKGKPFFLVCQHPVTTEYALCRKQVRETLDVISELKIQTIMLYPNVDAGSKDMVREIRMFEQAGKIKHVLLWKNIVFEDYISLLKITSCIIGNSSSGIREACYFGTPAVNIGTRQNGRERGKNVVDVGYNREEIKRAVLESLKHGKYEPEYLYGKGESSRKIADILSTIDLKNITQKKITF